MRVFFKFLSVNAVYLFTSPFFKGGLRGILSNKSPPAPLFQRGGLNNYNEVGEVKVIFEAPRAHIGKLIILVC